MEMVKWRFVSMTGVRKMPLISVVVVYMVGLILHCLRYTLSFESFLP